MRRKFCRRRTEPFQKTKAANEQIATLPTLPHPLPPHQCLGKYSAQRNRIRCYLVLLLVQHFHYTFTEHVVVLLFIV